MQKAKTGDFLFPKILNRLKNSKKEEIYISKKKVALGFLTILLLGLLNAGTIFLKNDSVVPVNNSRSVVEEYFPSNNQSIAKIFSQ